MTPKFLAALALIAASPLRAQESAQDAAPAATPSVDPQIATPISGDWTYSSVAGGTQATFSSAGGQPQLSIICTRASRQVTFSKPATGIVPFLNVWTSSLSRDVPASYDPATHRITARVPDSDPLLDALVFSRARIAFTVRGSPQLVLPNFAEVTRVIEDCRA